MGEFGHNMECSLKMLCKANCQMILNSIINQLSQMMQCRSEAESFRRILGSIRKSINSTALQESIRVLAQLVNTKLDRSQNIEALRASHELTEAQLSLSRLCSERIQKSMKELQPFSEDSIYFSNLFDFEGASLIVVFLPKGREFSLHNHPSMLVLTKPLSGRLQIDSMDLDSSSHHPSHPTVEPFEEKNHSYMMEQTNCSECEYYQQLTKVAIHQVFQDHNKTKEIRNTHNSLKCPLVAQKHRIFKTINWQRKVFTNKDISITSPQLGNIHGLLAETDCIFLDILIPDYQSSPTYYEYEIEPKKYCAFLREIESPKEQNLYVSLDELQQYCIQTL